jgi:hypothetical protein
VLQEIQRALYGAYRLARLDRDGMAYFDVSADGFWRSFLAPILGAPIYYLLLELGNAVAPEGSTVEPAVELLGYAIAWVGFLGLMIPVARAAGLGAHYAAFVVVFNWCQVFIMLVMLPVMGLAAAGIVPLTAAGVVIVAITFAALGFLWFIARVALAASVFVAIEVVLLDFLINQVAFAGLRYLLTGG